VPGRRLAPTLDPPLARNSIISAIFGIEIAVVYSSDLSAGTAGTGRVHPRRAADRAGTGRRVFFQNRALPVSYPCPSWVHGYHRYGYGVLEHTGRRVKRYNGLLNRYNDL
jgi:hypothetical protein